MSRSVHTTRRTIINLRKSDFSSAETRKAALSEARKEYRKKRRIKAYVHRERKQKAVEIEVNGPAGELVERIPIVIADSGKFIHHGASVEDIRAVLAQLPPETIEGIAEIRLCMDWTSPPPTGKRMRTLKDVFDDEDSCEMLPGVLATDTLGCHFSRTGLICIYAFACDPGQYVLPGNLCELYLRLSALTTLVHEVAHHHDRRCRTARGRWRMDRRENNERYAEKMQHTWTQEIVLRYLEATYPADASGLCDWVAHHGGFVRPLSFFAGDPRVTTRDGKEVCRMVSVPFNHWARQLPECKTLLDSRLELAWSFHYADDFDCCMEIVDALLTEHPEKVEVLKCRADTLIHLERHAEALAATDQILKLQPGNQDVWMHRGDALIGLRKWRQVLVHCAKWEKAGKLERWQFREMQAHRATAYCAMGNEAMVEACFEAVLDCFPKVNETATGRRRWMFMREVYKGAGKPLPPENDSHGK